MPPCNLGWPSNDRQHVSALLSATRPDAAPGSRRLPLPPNRPPPVLALSDAELAARLGFLEERLDAARPTALAWQWGWTGFYSASLALNVGYAIEAEDGDDRVRAIVDATKSGVATVQTLTLLRDPLPANVGAQPMRDVPGDDRAARLERLAVGERQLLASAAARRDALQPAAASDRARRQPARRGGDPGAGRCRRRAAVHADRDRDRRGADLEPALACAGRPARLPRHLPGRAGISWDLRAKGRGVELVFRF